MEVCDRVMIISNIYRNLGVTLGMRGTVLYKREQYDSYVVVFDESNYGNKLENEIDIEVKAKYIMKVND